MEQLVSLVAQKAGIGEDKARIAVESVVSFIKGRLPESMASQLDSVIAGGGAGATKDLTGKLGGLAGGLTGGFSSGSEGGGSA